jgi:type II secretory pathway component PulJ
MTETLQTVESLKTTDLFMLATAVLSMVGVFTTLLVTAFIFNRSKQDFSEIAELKRNLAALEVRLDESVYISDEIVNVLYDLFDLSAATNAYLGLVDSGYKIDIKLFKDMNRRVALLEKHFAELGLFSQDEERRKSVQLSLANMYGDADTLNLMRKIADGKIGTKDRNIRPSIKSLEARLKANRLYVDSINWTGRPSGGSF